MGTTISLPVRGKTRPFTSHNLIARLEGRESPDECVLYTAHWDHVGTNPALPGDDKIMNGAVDNASGTAGLIELARAFAALPERPKRTVLFVATTCEEKGLIGSEYLSRHPVVPLAQERLDRLRGAHVAFTGIFSRPRRDLVAAATRAGATVHGGPSARTTVVVRGKPNPQQAAGPDAGLKLMEVRRLRAKGHRIALIGETQFWALVGKPRASR